MVYRIPCSQIYIGKDQLRTGDETDRTLRCLRVGDYGEVGCSGACVREPPPDPLGGDHSAGPWERTGAVGEGGPAHSNDTLGGVLQPGWHPRSPWLLDWRQGGRSSLHWLNSELQWCISLVVHGYKKHIHLMMTRVFSRNIGKWLTELKLASDNFFIQASPSTAYYTLGVTLVILPVYKITWISDRFSL